MKREMFLCAVMMTISLNVLACQSCNREMSIRDTSADVADDGPAVGGPCTYDEYAGSCTVDSIDEASGVAQFTFVGDVGSVHAILPVNSVKGDYEPLQVFDCKLGFINKGTCTPCLFTSPAGGECGSAAWELFRNAK